MAPKWVWLPASPTGGTGGGAYAKLFRNDALPPADLLAREVLQNSWDAAQVHTDKSAPAFRFRFRFAELKGAKKARFLTTMDGKSLTAQRGKLGDPRDVPASESVTRILDPESPLVVLYLEDFGTHGMFGDPVRIGGSHLYKALYVIGSTSKDMDIANRGGSYGFGKSAFIGSSELRTAIVHTRFASRKDDKATQRLIGFTWWGEHEVGKHTFEGRAMFGSPAREARLGAHPLTDREAAELARALGMPLRADDPSDLGSTVMLIAPTVGPKEVKEAVERHWWPALEDHSMDVVIETTDGQELVPRPRLNSRLRPFITAYGIATGTKKPRNPAEERLASSKWRKDGDGTAFGRLALVIDRDGTASSSGNLPDESDGGSPTVALIRGPRMVVEYRTFSSRLPIRGVYVADPSIDALLREVEPPLHNSWENASATEVSERARYVAQGVLTRIKRSVKEFAQEFAPPPSTVHTDLPLFGNLLSQFFSGRGAGKPHPPKPSEKPASLSFKASRADVREKLSGGKMTLTRVVAVQIPDQAQWDGASLDVAFTAAIAWDLSAASSEEIQLSVHAPSTFVHQDDTGHWVGPVGAGESVEFVVSTAPYDEDLTVVLTPSAVLTPTGTTGARS